MPLSRLGGCLFVAVLLYACAPSGKATTRRSALSLVRGTASGAGTAPMGATYYGAGTTFRVWAPNASQVFVAGDFNGWDVTANELSAENGGTFAADVEGALPGHQYKYVITSEVGTRWKADPRALQMISSAGNSLILDPSSYQWLATDYQPPPFEQQVLYELHLGTFNDTTGPGTGTWSSAADKLDYLADLGVNLLEVLPPAQFPWNFSWGYNPSSPFAPVALYGAPEEMKAFIDGAHFRGMGVIIDIVHNHWGPQDLSMWCFDGPCFGAGGIYFYSDWRLETGFGPRPDYRRTEVQDYIVDNARMWLQDYRADGLRWDSTVNIRRARSTDLPEGWQLLQRINDTLKFEAPGKIQIAEDLQNYARVTQATSSGGAGFDSQWDPSFFWPIKNAIVSSSDPSRNMNSVRDAVVHRYNGNGFERVVYTENHDEVAPHNGPNRRRIPDLIWPGHADSYYSKKRSTLGAAIALTVPGIPMLFMGQEFLESIPFPFNRAQALDWSKATTFAGIRQLYRDLIRLRRNWGGRTRGLQGDHVQAFHVNNQDKLIAYHRWQSGGRGDDVIVLANFSNRAFPSYDIGLPRSGAWRVRLNSDWSGYSSDFGDTPSNDLSAQSPGMDGLPFRGSVGIGPYTVVILSQEP